MNFPSIDIQGSIISADLLAKIRSEQATFQQGKDFSKDYTNAKLKDEISSAWQDTKGQWNIFQNKLTRLQPGDTGTTETRNFWIVPLLSNLGYNLSFSRQAEELNGKPFPIAYRDSQRDGFPVYISGFHEALDKRPENKQLRVSPHAMIQEYLNYSEHLYGLVTNGRQLRLLRDASRITRLSYVEFNLQKMMEEDLYSDFVLLFRLLHVSRMPQKMDGGAESIIEKYHHEGLEAGSTIRNKLGSSVKDSIKSLANGFINHPDNGNLRVAMQQGHLDADVYYRQQLRIIYRLLFLFVIEERNLVYAESKAQETKRFSQIYINYYSLLQLRKLAKKLPPADANRHYDLWQSLLGTFALFEETAIGEKLGIMSLQGELFGPGSISTSYYDLHDCRLSNALVLQIIKALSYFENQAGVKIAVNYGGLNVEEFGSVYEGLLELKLNIEPVVGTDNFSCSYAGSEERSKSGSHYTPDELVEPLIKHSLDYLLEDRKEIISDIIAKQRLTGPAFRLQRQALVNQHIFSLKVCDIACGSGHLLISGARRIAEVAACIIEEEEQPNPKAFQLAKRNAILNCIYGVDKNPLAIELCKVALWLEAYVPGQPLNFLDHHIKCGDAIIGLAYKEELEKGISDEAFKTLPGDDKEISQAYMRKNKQERLDKKQIVIDFETNVGNELNEAIAEYKRFNGLPENTPEEINVKQKAYRKFENETHKMRLEQLADAQVAQFFIPKTTANKDKLITDTEYRKELNRNAKAIAAIQNPRFAFATAIARQNRFFHWFLEFPEVLNKGGFDCILGNPPYLGGKRISGNYGDDYLNAIKTLFQPADGGLDLVIYFVRRIFGIQKEGAFFSIITTNTISQGDSRRGGLEYLLKNNAVLVFVADTIPWPGKANVKVTLFSLYKGSWLKNRILNNKSVPYISDIFEDVYEQNPAVLNMNLEFAYCGSVLSGEGFILSAEEASNLMNNKNNECVIKPFINGDDLNNTINQSFRRFVIDFKDWDEKKASEYNDCFERIMVKVKPEREKVKRRVYREHWWQFAEKAVNLYRKISTMDFVLATARTSKTLAFAKIPSKCVFSANLTVFTNDKWSTFAILQSNLHSVWAWKYGTTLKSDLIYAPSDIVNVFPFPSHLIKDNEWRLEQIGAEYHEHRRKLMFSLQLGLTKTYNFFHAKEIVENLTLSPDLALCEKKTIEKHYGKGVWNLWNHLQKTPGTCNIEEVIAGIIKLRELHVEMDQAVLDAYGWTDIVLKHDFYEVDYLPENDRVRYTIHPDARREVLKRLLDLNHKIHDEEMAAGLWDKKTTKPKSYKTHTSESNLVKEKEIGFGDLFDVNGV